MSNLKFVLSIDSNSAFTLVRPVSQYIDYLGLLLFPELWRLEQINTMASITRDVEFKTYDGVTLRGTLYPAGDKRPAIIMSNGVSSFSLLR